MSADIHPYGDQLMAALALLLQENARLRADVIQIRAMLTNEQRSAGAIDMQNDSLNLKEAAHICGVSGETMRRYARDHRLGVYQGGRWRIDRDKLEAFRTRAA